MKVRATRLGYDGERRRREGEEFDLSDPKKFSPSWMVKLESEPHVSSGEFEPPHHHKSKKGKSSSSEVI
jgi:hypothetical protein